MKQEVVFVNNSTLTISNLSFIFSEAGGILTCDISCQISANGMILNNAPTNPGNYQNGNIYIAIGQNIAQAGGQNNGDIEANGAAATFVDLSAQIAVGKKDLGDIIIIEE